MVSDTCELIVRLFGPLYVDIRRVTNLMMITINKSCTCECKDFVDRAKFQMRHIFIEGSHFAQNDPFKYIPISLA